MKLTKWMSGLLLFVVSIGVAIALSHSTASFKVPQNQNFPLAT